MDTRWVMSEGPQGAIAPPGARVKRRIVAHDLGEIRASVGLDFEKT